MPRFRRYGLIGLVLAAATILTGCGAGTVALEPAADANNPLCAEVSVRLPKSFESVGGSEPQQRRWTNAQATGAWGDPESVYLRCGVEPPGPSTLQCVTFGGVDWLVDSEDRPWLRITTYGRTPAVQVTVNSSVISADSVLDRLTSAVGRLPTDARCIAADEAPSE
ncbi:DUF3515 family protein [Microbacterium sp. YY-01]|uniref:DUF3515 family protein n=1 Tax=Microbacterium sp. YY-01 TaxID=3421634 RepID=UPI003D182790